MEFMVLSNERDLSVLFFYSFKCFGLIFVNLINDLWFSQIKNFVACIFLFDSLSIFVNLINVIMIKCFNAWEYTGTALENIFISSILF